jgi:hypothetical protein
MLTLKQRLFTSRPIKGEKSSLLALNSDNSHETTITNQRILTLACFGVFRSRSLLDNPIFGVSACVFGETPAGSGASLKNL